MSVALHCCESNEIFEQANLSISYPKNSYCFKYLKSPLLALARIAKEIVKSASISNKLLKHNKQNMEIHKSTCHLAAFSEVLASML